MIIKDTKKKVDLILIDYLLNIKNSNFRNIIDYSFNGGKRLRPMIIYTICNKLNINKNIRNKFIIGIELLHNASLIMDDMPNMDNDDFRRNKYSVHKKFGEKSAKIISNFMVIEAINNFVYYFKQNDKIKLLLKIYNFLHNKNIEICLGQHYDLNFKNLNKYKQTLYNLNLKTIPLFSICFIIPYMVKKEIPEDMYNHLEKIAENFSYMFQICDDLEDYENDKQKNLNNHILFFGRKQTIVIYENSKVLFNKLLKQCNIEDIFFDELLIYLNNKYKKYKDG